MGKTLMGRAHCCAAVLAAAATLLSMSMAFAATDAAAHGTCTPFAQVMLHNLGNPLPVGPLGTTTLFGRAEVGCADIHDSLEICVELQRQPVGSVGAWTTVAEDCSLITSQTGGTAVSSPSVPCSTANWRAVGYGHVTSSTGGNHSFATVTPGELRVCNLAPTF